MSLNLVYHFQSSQSQDGDFRPASYRMIYFFSNQGFVGEDLIRNLRSSVPEANDDLTFVNLEDLKYFALRVSEDLQETEVRLISVQDYNIGLDGAGNLVEFREIFKKYGELVINENAPKKKGLLGKIFG